jgi:uncharacterized protein YkwD
MDPSILIEKLEEQLTWFSIPEAPFAYCKTDSDFCILTNEGPDLWQETIDFLKTQAAVNPLEWDDDLHDAAAYHTADIGAAGLVQHESSDGQGSIARIQSFFTES